MNAPSEDEIGRMLTLIALFGCARKDAAGNATTIRRLTITADLLKDPKIPTERIVRQVFAVMGPTWNPINTEGEWGEWLQSLLDERRRDQ